MGSILIFEGPPGSGKSTAIDNLLGVYKDKNIPTEFYHNGKFKSQKAAHKAYRTQLFNALQFDGVTILDRAHIAELIYSKVYNNHEDDINDFFALDDAFSKADAKVIWCNPPLEVCKSNWAERLEQEAFHDPIKYDILHNMHELIPYLTRCDVSTIDYTKETTHA